MACFRPAVRLAARSRFAHPLPIVAFARRSYAAPGRRPATDEKPIEEAEEASEDFAPDQQDPNMNGGYPDPSLESALPIKRSHRDPYGDWWDPIERRNYGETVHEDNDILGVLSTEDYNHFTPGWGAFLLGCFVASVGALGVVVGRFYPDKPSAPRTFPGGLETELGGPIAIRARMADTEESIL